MNMGRKTLAAMAAIHEFATRAEALLESGEKLESVARDLPAFKPAVEPIAQMNTSLRQMLDRIGALGWEATGPRRV